VSITPAAKRTPVLLTQATNLLQVTATLLLKTFPRFALINKFTTMLISTIRQVKKHMTLVRESLGEDIWRLTNSSLILHQVDSQAQKLAKRGNIWGLTNSSLILH
jgi:hypothetical protein